eukprot:4091346-Pleurochrysis_carterae.AAC.1
MGHGDADADDEFLYDAEDDCTAKEGAAAPGGDSGAVEKPAAPPSAGARSTAVCTADASADLRTTGAATSAAGAVSYTHLTLPTILLV